MKPYLTSSTRLFTRRSWNGAVSNVSKNKIAINVRLQLGEIIISMDWIVGVENIPSAVSMLPKSKTEEWEPLGQARLGHVM